MPATRIEREFFRLQAGALSTDVRRRLFHSWKNIPYLQTFFFQIRFMAHKFLGEVVMPCHILTHEDTGMMMTTEIVNPGDP